MRKTFLRSLLLVGAAMTPALGQGLPAAAPETVGLSSERLGRISAKTKEYVDGGKLAGTITAVARRGKLVHFETRGLMDAEADQPMRADTLFRIYSMTKPVTGVAVMILYEEGRFLLDDPVSKYLPELAELHVYSVGKERARPMTIRHLLTHTSGLSYGFNGTAVAEMYQEAEIWGSESLEDFVRRVAALPLESQPGTRWNYSVSMDVLGRLVEVLSGEPFDTFLERRLFAPLGMVDTGFYVPEEKLDRFAALYQATSEGGFERVEAPEDEPAYTDPGAVPYGGGGLVSTAADYLRFAQMLADGGELDGVRILSRKTVELMTSNHLSPALGEEPMAHFTPWLQSSARGVGFGLTGAVITDVGQSGLVGSVGSFFWGGAASTFFWVDPSEEIVGLFLTQLMPSAAYPLRAEMRILTYQALVD